MRWPLWLAPMPPQATRNPRPRLPSLLVPRASQQQDWAYIPTHNRDKHVHTIGQSDQHTKTTTTPLLECSGILCRDSCHWVSYWDVPAWHCALLLLFGEMDLESQIPTNLHRRYRYKACFFTRASLWRFPGSVFAYADRNSQQSLGKRTVSPKQNQIHAQSTSNLHNEQGFLLCLDRRRLSYDIFTTSHCFIGYPKFLYFLAVQWLDLLCPVGNT